MTKPSEMLRALLEKHEITQDNFAKATGFSRISISQLVNDRRSVNARTALIFGKAFRMKPSEWIDAQIDHDLEQALADPRTRAALAEVKVVVNGK